MALHEIRAVHGGAAEPGGAGDITDRAGLGALVEVQRGAVGGLRRCCWGSPRNAVSERRSMLSECNGSELRDGVANPVLKTA